MEFSYITLTLNITEEFNKKELKDAIDTYFRWIKVKLSKVYNIKIDSILYVYTYEISKELHIHIHIMINQEIEKEFKEKLLKDWNEYNKWPWYNKKSILIKNNNEYDISVIDLINLEYKKGNEYKVEKELG